MINVAQTLSSFLKFKRLFHQRKQKNVAIEIRTYDEESSQLSEFVVSTWLKSYREKMSVPDWSPEYFDWQMTGKDYSDRNYLISAWSGTKLIGTMLGLPFPLWVNGQEVNGVQGSWLAVDPEFRRDGVALMMSQEMNRRQKERNCYGRLGYAFVGSKKSQGPRFWRSAKTKAHFVRKMFLWARVLHPEKVHAWSNKPIEKGILKLLPSFVYRIPKPNPGCTIRSYEPEDLSSCLELINEQAKESDLAILWTEKRLQKQLSCPNLAETLVIEREGNVIGFLNFHLLGLFLRGRITSAIIDLFACQHLNSTETFSLLVSAMKRMEEQGTDLVLMREFSHQPSFNLLKARFTPQLSDSILMLNRECNEEEQPLKKKKKIQILWR